METRCFIISSMNQVSHSSTLNQSANTGNSQPLPDVDGFTNLTMFFHNWGKAEGLCSVIVIKTLPTPALFFFITWYSNETLKQSISTLFLYRKPHRLKKTSFYPFLLKNFNFIFFLYIYSWCNVLRNMFYSICSFVSCNNVSCKDDSCMTEGISAPVEIIQQILDEILLPCLFTWFPSLTSN